MRALLLRDLRLAFRAGGGFGLALAFFLLVAVIVPLGVGPDGATLGRIAPGILWVGALLSSLLSLDRMFALDHEVTIRRIAFSPLRSRTRFRRARRRFPSAPRFAGCAAIRSSSFACTAARRKPTVAWRFLVALALRAQ